MVEQTSRPDPDELLARVQAEEARQQRGKLKVFFGATAGVGKTYAMLEAAHGRKDEGIDVVVGWVDTHGRQETADLLEGLEVIPRRDVEYRGTTLQEFDLDAALHRRPQLILVDELAHTNAPGSRHPKRWQDVDELLDAGIDVYTTVNVQHLESLNDVVAQITNVVVRETVPDSFLEQADSVELIDLPPDELIQRLNEGKVYVPHQAERAARSFFRKGNLIALRELALRRTADRVDAQMQEYMRDHAIAQTWPTAERILVCVSPSPLAARLVRAARRMAAGLRAEWIVAFVETPAALRLPEETRDRVVQTLRLAERLGAQTVTLSGQSVHEEILSYAHAHNVTKIIVGKPTHARWRDLFFGSVLDTVVRNSGEIDVYVISGDQEEGRSSPTPVLQRTSDWSAYGSGVLLVGLCTIVAWLMFPRFAEANIVMVYLLGVVYVAARFGRGPSVLASILSVVAFDVFFVVPYFTLTVENTEYIITFAVMLVVALVISTLTVRLRQQMQAARARERRTAALYAMSRDLARLRGAPHLLQSAAQHIAEVFDSRIVILMPDASARLAVQVAVPSDFALPDAELGVAQWAYEHGQMAGLGSDTLPGADALYVPLKASHGTLGILGVCPANTRQLLAPEQLHLLETFANQTALAIERANLAEETERTKIQIETERLRSSLLSSVSHDLRTPLASITGAASSLMEDESLDPATRRELAQTAYDEAYRLNRLVSNLLDMTRLESGTLQVQKEWQPLEEVVGAALTRLEPTLKGRPVATRLDPDLPLVPLDGVLMEQALVNLLENAVKYTPPGSLVEIAAWPDRTLRVPAPGRGVTVEIADRGPGVPPGDESRIFEKFYRGQPGRLNTGAGLGLAICQAIVEAHGGRIWVEARPEGGASFRFWLPFDGQPPTIELERVATSPEPTPEPTPEPDARN